MINSFYTRGGDEGYTGLLGKGRIPKEDLRIEALGTIDEANAALGLARAHARSPEAAGLIINIQRDLYGLMSEVAATPETAGRFYTIDSAKVAWLETQADTIGAVVGVPGEFIVPGDTVNGAFFDLARAVVRRAERRVAELLHRGDIGNPDLLRYLNRLSSLCYVLELLEHKTSGSAKISLARTDDGK